MTSRSSSRARQATRSTKSPPAPPPADPPDSTIAPPRPLNDRQERFCQEYLIDCNGTQSAMRAGYAKGSARQTAVDLLGNDRISARIHELMMRRAERQEISQDEVIQELRIIGLSNVEDYIIDDAGAVQAAEGARPGAMRAVSSIRRRVTTTKDGVRTVDTEVRLWSKTEALQSLGRHLGLFNDKLHITGSINVSELSLAELELLSTGEATVADILARRAQ